MSRSEKIATILVGRAEKAKELHADAERIARAATALAELDNHRQFLLSQLDDASRDVLLDLGSEIRAVEDELAGALTVLAQVCTRLSRDSLNVGIVGRARQGKSLFLQKLTGLSNVEIPDGDGAYCTGVPSLVHNRPGRPTTAEVHLHNQQSFLATVVAPYFHQLDLGPAPTRLDAFAGPLPALRSSDPVKGAAYDHLVAYHDLLPDYRDLLQTPSPKPIAREQIREFVAQDDEQGHRRYNNFRAVQKVVIRTPFRTDAGDGLAVIDLPGLGDTNLGDARLLLTALRDEVDVVIFVRMPGDVGDAVSDKDVALYSLAKDALPEIPLELRSFLFLNHRRGKQAGDPGNLANAERMKESVAVGRIRVVDTRIVDCSDADAVSSAFDPVIDYLLGHAGTLDDYLLTECRDRLAAIDSRLRALLETAGRVAVLAQPSSSWFPLFQRLSDETFKRFAIALEQLVGRLEAERGTPDDSFVRAVAEVCGVAAKDHGIPSTGEISARIATEGARSLAYGQLLIEARAHLSRHFLGLDSALKTRVSEMQSEVAEVLAEQGALRGLSSVDGRDFLLAVADRAPGGLPPSPETEIAGGLRMLANFELNYRGFIQHRIRPCLDGLHPDHPTYSLADASDVVPVALIQEVLHVTYQDALGQCESALRAISAEPNGALFAIVEEFADRVLRSAGVRGDWRIFHESCRAELWPGPLAEVAERSGRFREWSTAVAALGAAWLPRPAPDGPARPGATDHPQEEQDGDE